MDIHMKLQELVEHLDAEYERRLRFLAQKLLNEHVIPVCERQNWIKFIPGLAAIPCFAIVAVMVVAEGLRWAFRRRDF